MKLFYVFLAAIVVSAHSQASGGERKYSDYPIAMVNIRNVELTDSFWLPKIRTIQTVTIASGLEKCRQEGRLDNFLIAGGRKQGKVHGKMPFDDTDVYKIIEGASYSLISAPDKKLDNLLDSVISIIRIGQEPDGYLTTWFTIDSTNPPATWVPKVGARWMREASSHELYNSGHLFEAAAAHYTATGKRNLLDIALKNADLLVDNFGPGKRTIPPGHQIVETGLVKLYRITKNEKYLRLARYFLELRGNPETHRLYGEYSQDHRPVVQQDKIVGHAVRAVYMYAGMTDIAALYGDTLYLNAVSRIWKDLVERKIYITGGIGSRHEGESVGNDYELPNLTAYGETCASIGSVYWNTRLFMLSGEAKYFDVIEQTMYNGLISGISLDGNSFFYVNPLESDGKFKFNSGFRTRQPWFDCSCCPTNLIRFIPSIPGLIYSLREDTLYVNLYISSKADISVCGNDVRINQKSGLPWNGNIKLDLEMKKSGKYTLKLRIPGWSQNNILPGGLYSYINTTDSKFIVKINGKEIDFITDRGYAVIGRNWQSGDEINVDISMAVCKVAANENVKSDSNMSAIEYGPLVYCLEGIDNRDELDNITLPDTASLVLEKNIDLPDGVYAITGIVPMRNNSGMFRITGVPYYIWSNRGAGKMKVWLPKN